MPTLDLQVGASTDDCTRGLEEDAFSLTAGYLYCGWGGAAGVSQRGCGMRFLNVTIPQGATITTAYLTFTASASQAGTTVNSRITAEDVDDAGTFSTKADFDSRYAAHTTAVVDWDGIGAWVLDTEYQSPEIKTVIQEVVDRGGWASGNALVLFWQDFDDRSTAQGATRQGYSYDGSATKCAKLHVEYTGVTAKTSSDTGSGADAYVSLVIVEAKSSSDTGSGVEGTPVPSASLSGSESGSGIEVLVARLLVAVDTGTGIEVAQLVGLLNDLFATDGGEGSDLLVAKIEMPTKGGGMKLWT